MGFLRFVVISKHGKHDITGHRLFAPIYSRVTLLEKAEI